MHAPHLRRKKGGISIPTLLLIDGMSLWNVTNQYLD